MVDINKCGFHFITLCSAYSNGKGREYHLKRTFLKLLSSLSEREHGDAFNALEAVGRDSWVFHIAREISDSIKSQDSDENILFQMQLIILSSCIHTNDAVVNAMWENNFASTLSAALRRFLLQVESSAPHTLSTLSFAMLLKLQRMNDANLSIFKYERLKNIWLNLSNLTTGNSREGDLYRWFSPGVDASDFLLFIQRICARVTESLLSIPHYVQILEGSPCLINWIKELVSCVSRSNNNKLGSFKSVAGFPSLAILAKMVERSSTIGSMIGECFEADFSFLRALLSLIVIENEGNNVVDEGELHLSKESALFVISDASLTLRAFLRYKNLNNTQEKNIGWIIPFAACIASATKKCKNLVSTIIASSKSAKAISDCKFAIASIEKDRKEDKELSGFIANSKWNRLALTRQLGTFGVFLLTCTRHSIVSSAIVQHVAPEDLSSIVSDCVSSNDQNLQCCSFWYAAALARGCVRKRNGRWIEEMHNLLVESEPLHLDAEDRNSTFLFAISQCLRSTSENKNIDSLHASLSFVTEYLSVARWCGESNLLQARTQNDLEEHAYDQLLDKNPSQMFRWLIDGLMQANQRHAELGNGNVKAQLDESLELESSYRFAKAQRQRLIDQGAAHIADLEQCEATLKEEFQVKLDSDRTDFENKLNDEKNRCIEMQARLNTATSLVTETEKMLQDALNEAATQRRKTEILEDRIEEVAAESAATVDSIRSQLNESERKRQSLMKESHNALERSISESREARRKYLECESRMQSVYDKLIRLAKAYDKVVFQLNKANEDLLLARAKDQEAEELAEKLEVVIGKIHEQQAFKDQRLLESAEQNERNAIEHEALEKSLDQANIFINEQKELFKTAQKRFMVEQKRAEIAESRVNEVMNENSRLRRMLQASSVALQKRKSHEKMAQRNSTPNSKELLKVRRVVEDLESVAMKSSDMTNLLPTSSITESSPSRRNLFSTPVKTFDCSPSYNIELQNLDIGNKSDMLQFEDRLDFVLEQQMTGDAGEKLATVGNVLQKM
eukprot:g5426.t1